MIHELENVKVVEVETYYSSPYKMLKRAYTLALNDANKAEAKRRELKLKVKGIQNAEKYEVLRMLESPHVSFNTVESVLKRFPDDVARKEQLDDRLALLVRAWTPKEFDAFFNHLARANPGETYEDRKTYPNPNWGLINLCRNPSAPKKFMLKVLRHMQTRGIEHLLPFDDFTCEEVLKAWPLAKQDNYGTRADLITNMVNLRKSWSDEIILKIQAESPYKRRNKEYALATAVALNATELTDVVREVFNASDIVTSLKNNGSEIGPAAKEWFEGADSVQALKVKVKDSTDSEFIHAAATGEYAESIAPVAVRNEHVVRKTLVYIHENHRRACMRSLLRRPRQLGVDRLKVIVEEFANDVASDMEAFFQRDDVTGPVAMKVFHAWLQGLQTQMQQAKAKEAELKAAGQYVGYEVERRARGARFGDVGHVLPTLIGRGYGVKLYEVGGASTDE